MLAQRNVRLASVAANDAPIDQQLFGKRRTHRDHRAGYALLVGGQHPGVPALHLLLPLPGLASCTICCMAALAARWYSTSRIAAGMTSSVENASRA